MKDSSDKFTSSLPGVPKRRGRPPLPPGQAKTDAQRAAAYRARKGLVSVSLDIDSMVGVVAALQAAVDCPMLKKEDRAALAVMLRKFEG